MVMLPGRSPLDLATGYRKNRVAFFVSTDAGRLALVG
jgi:hypothetical protein